MKSAVDNAREEIRVEGLEAKGPATQVKLPATYYAH